MINILNNFKDIKKKGEQIEQMLNIQRSISLFLLNFKFHRKIEKFVVNLKYIENVY